MQSTDDKRYLSRTLEATIHIGLTALLTAACLLILLPFLPLLAWGIIIAVAAYPSFCKLRKMLGERTALPAILFTVALLAVLIVPVFLLADSLIGAIQTVAAAVKSGNAV